MTLGEKIKNARIRLGWTQAKLAETIGVNVCVEGIETAGMRDILMSYNVESLQGYYYAKPLLLEQFLEWK